MSKVRNKRGYITTNLTKIKRFQENTKIFFIKTNQIIQIKQKISRKIQTTETLEEIFKI